MPSQVIYKKKKKGRRRKAAEFIDFRNHVIAYDQRDIQIVNNG